jgi:seryl-tRNA synthetase
MDKQKLTPVEIEILQSFMSKYENFSNELEKYQKGLEEIELKKQDLMEGIKNLSKQLDKVREDEAENANNLIKKYGEFELDLETFEIQIT